MTSTDCVTFKVNGNDRAYCVPSTPVSQSDLTYIANQVPEISPAHFRSVVPQVPAQDFTPQTILFEDTIRASEDVTYDNGVFTFHISGETTFILFKSVGRSGNGSQERIWLWLEEETAPDVWTQVGGSTVTGVTNQMTVLTAIPFSIPVTEGHRFRFRMEAQDASEGVGLYPEDTSVEFPTANHGDVASAAVIFTVQQLGVPTLASTT